MHVDLLTCCALTCGCSPGYKRQAPTARPSSFNSLHLCEVLLYFLTRLIFGAEWALLPHKSHMSVRIARIDEVTAMFMIQNEREKTCFDD